MTRLWQEGACIQVEMDSLGVPLCFTWDRQAHIVQNIANRWLTDAGWWKRHVWREYFKVTTDKGWLLIIYHDLTDDAWYVQRLYD